MKKSVFVLLACIAFLAQAKVVEAQSNRQQQFERVETEKIAFITKELQLTPKEAQEFFPLYNEYRKELSSLMSSHRMHDTDHKRPRTKDELAIDAEILELKKKYRTRFSTAIGAARASRFFEVEREFREKLYQELRRRGGGRNRNELPEFKV